MKPNKRNKKNNARFENSAKDNGYTIIETLFSLLLMSLALLLITQTIASAFDTNRKSHIRFHMTQQVEFYRNQLLSKPFEAIALEQGSYSTADGLFKRKWDITNISPTLKLIRLSISYKRITKKAYFYKSKYIKNNEPTEVKND